MKKVFYLVAVATFVFFSCKKEVVSPVESQNSLTLRASIEQLASPTKADINANNELVWAKGDQIGVYVNGWADNSNQSFTLEGDGGATTGSFARTSETWFETDQAQLAFFPWTSANATTVNVNTDNNVSGTTAYFKLPASYSGYTSGKMFTPLLATMSYNSTESKYDPIEFKHVGAAVKVTINNLPAGAHSIGMKVDGQQIHGDFHATPNNAIAVDEGKENVANNEIWLNFEPAATERAFTFLFPVPTLTTPKLIFKIYDDNDILVWEKKLKAQTNSLARADVLEMPEIDIEPYAQFNTVSAFTVHGTLDGTDWKDFAMVTDGSKSIAKGLVFSNMGEFKVTDGTNWYPDNNWVVNTADTYDIIFDNTSHNISVVKSNCPYPDAGSNVTFYVHPTTAVVNELCFKSDVLGTDSWPGTPFATTYDIIAGQKYYKMEVPASKVWGKTITDLYVVDRETWQTKSGGCTLTFPGNKKEYFIIATKNTDLELLANRPAEPSITIDGVFTDWATVSGNTNEPSSTGNVSTLKAYSDGTSLYLYHKMTPGSGVTFDLSGWRYFRLYFDTDNDVTTGWDTTHWLYAGADLVAHGSESNHDILVYHSKGGVANASIEDVVEPYQIKAVANADGSIEVELKMSLSELGTITGDEIKIYSVSSVASSQASYGILGGVMIPTVTP